MEYNISEAELPTMVVRYENKLILRSVITGQHLEDLGLAPIWDEVTLTPALQERRQRIEAAHNAALEALVQLYPYEEPVKPHITQVPPQMQPVALSMPRQLPQTKSVPLLTARQPNPLVINETELPPCKVHRNYCCNYCSFCTQNPRSHLLHQRQVHGIRLSIHCCHHCQYASRYFQKLKRHVKMVHMGNSPGRTKIRNRMPARKVPKPKLVTATTSINGTETVSQPSQQNEQPNITVNKPPPQPAQLQHLQQPIATAFQKPNLPANNVMKQSMVTPALLKNPEAFFEAAYRNQLVQQQLQVQRFKEFVELSNQMKKVNQNVSSKMTATATVTTVSPNPPKNLLQNRQVPEKSLPTAAQISEPNVNAASFDYNHATSSAECSETALELEKKCIYGCRKCSYVTHIKSRYNKHVKYHSMPMIQCDKCEFRTTYKWNLTRHLRSHHGNGLYKCSVCSFSAHMKQSLTSHELNHHSPPVGQIARMRNKPLRRRRCRVGGSDLMHEMRTAFNNASKTHATLEPITADSRESLKLVIKREAGTTNSYTSSRTMPHDDMNNMNQASEVIPTEQAISTTMFPATLDNIRISYSSSESFSSSSSNSPSSAYSSVSVGDHEAPLNKTDSIGLTTANQEHSNQQDTSKLQCADFQITAVSHISNAEFQALPIQSEVPKLPITPSLATVPEALTKLPPTQIVEYSSSVDSDSDSEDSDDSYSTVSANETVPHGLHIAYDSSSPDHGSSTSDIENDSEHSLKINNNLEISHENGLPENVTTSL